MLKMKIVLVTLLVLPLVGCASKASKNVDNKVWQENGVGSRKDLQEESFRLIHDEPGLSPDQRDRLALLSSTMTQKLDVINLNGVRLAPSAIG
jgi:type IV pilus biogenesis protein CpaD/CtpE